jgi:ankyrin repeat protein
MADVDVKDNDGRGALHLAAKNGHEAVLRLLLKHMVDADTKDNDERTALHLATENGHEAVLRLLLEHKVDVDAVKLLGQELNCANN